MIPITGRRHHHRHPRDVRHHRHPRDVRRRHHPRDVRRRHHRNRARSRWFHPSRSRRITIIAGNRRLRRLHSRRRVLSRPRRVPHRHRNLA